ncbi:hypothetical protein [Clostridium sp. UBA1652]|uniref:hypothetical protein n=1 Tax=Clostridium sp. UBA1652 TaxID=1946348 RepID=UPI002580330A|nr:hypothetical protein [Clostridium sp. UBA1652]
MKYEKPKTKERSKVKGMFLISLLVIIYILLRINIPSFDNNENLGLLIFMFIILTITFRKKFLRKYFKGSLYKEKESINTKWLIDSLTVFKLYRYQNKVLDYHFMII